MALTRVFIANRGEIALRIVRAAQALGIETVVGVSDADRDSAAARAATRAVVLGPGPAAKSYLDAELVVHAARETGCDGLHPGYGFLSERPVLPRLCTAHGIAFVGPDADTIAALGDKLSARALARAAGVPLVPGSDEIASVADAVKVAEDIGYPVLLKASAGGGGRGMVIAHNRADVEAGFAKASAEAESAFGDGTLFMERFVPFARHVEVQLMGDGTGKVLHFGERDCSVQRRYQKLIEEAPAAALPDKLRRHLHDSAVALAASVKYKGAGTAEFLYDEARGEIYFIEVNARIQVEHPVSEMVTGHDLVGWQLRIAGGEPLDIDQSDIAITGHAIECRINAENWQRGFIPSPGTITRWQPPTGEHIRLDTHISAGAAIPPFYDSMVGKLIVSGATRTEAIARLDAALAEFAVEGVPTTIGLHRAIVAHADFRANRLHTRWLEQVLLPTLEQ